MKFNSALISKVSLFLIYFWFGILKVLQLSPATPLVKALHFKTTSFIPFDTFFILFGLFECIIGLMFLVRGLEKHVFYTTLFHVFLTFLPLILLPGMVWSGFLVPTLEGQYIIKNLLIVSLMLSLKKG